jgi:hypothetical protein
MDRRLSYVGLQVNRSWHPFLQRGAEKNDIPLGMSFAIGRASAI